jgi:hypothetical protein
MVALSVNNNLRVRSFFLKLRIKTALINFGVATSRGVTVRRDT